MSPPDPNPRKPPRPLPSALSLQRPCTNPHPHSQNPLPVSHTPRRLPSPYLLDRHILLLFHSALGLSRKHILRFPHFALPLLCRHIHLLPRSKPPRPCRTQQNQRNRPRQKTATQPLRKHQRLAPDNPSPSPHSALHKHKHSFPKPTAPPLSHSTKSTQPLPSKYSSQTSTLGA